MSLEDVEKIIRKEPIETYYDVGNELGRSVAFCCIAVVMSIDTYLVTYLLTVTAACALLKSNHNYTNNYYKHRVFNYTFGVNLLIELPNINIY